MLSIFDGLRDLNMATTLLRMLLATLLGGAIGLERSTKNLPAGLRTHILVCMGSAVATMTGLYLFLELKLPADISRISSQVIAGLGFIGAGTIIITRKMTIKGLTTAAGLWTTGIIGLAAGSGYYELAILGAILVLIAETLFASLARRIQSTPEYAIRLLYTNKEALDDVLRLCKNHRLSIRNVRIETLEDDAAAPYAAQVDLRGWMSREKLLEHIRQTPGIIETVGL